MGKKKPVAKPKPPAPDLSHIAEDLRPLAMAIAELKRDPRNARKHDARNIAAIANSLSRFGQRKPVVLNTLTGTVLAGNGTIEAAESIGWTHVAVVRVKDDPTTATGYALADNRTAELAVWDEAVLLELALEVKGADQSLFDDLAVIELLALEAEEEGEAGGEPAAVGKSYQVVVQCVDAKHQARVYAKLKREGLGCKVLTS